MWDSSNALAAACDLLAVVAHLALAIVVLPQFGQHRRRALRLQAALLSTALWAALDGAAQMGWIGERHWPAQLLLPLLDALRYGAWFAFILALMESRPSIDAAPASSSTGSSSAALNDGVAPPLRTLAWLGLAAVVALPLWRFFGDTPVALMQRPMAMAWMGLAIFGLVLLEQMLRNIDSDARWNAKPVCLGLGAVFVFDVFLFSQVSLFQQFDSDALSVRAAVHSMAVPLLWLASRRHKKWLDKLHVSRAAAFHSATLLIVGGYLLAISALGYYVRYTGGEWGRALQQVLLAVGLLALLLMALSGALRAKLRVYISKNFFSYRYDYRQEWLRFTAMLSASASPAQLGESVIRGMANLVEGPSGALWLRRPLGAAGESLESGPRWEFAQAARWNLQETREPIAQDETLTHWLRDRGWIVDLDEWRRTPAVYEHATLPDALTADTRHWLVVPLINAGELTGFVVLGQPRTKLELNWEVRDLLRTAARQAASYLAQMQAAEALLEARKFEAFNRMSAFVVHDLKNIVTQLSLMMKNAKRLRDNPEFQQDMLDTVENSLEKMRQLMLQLREGDKPHHGVTGGVALPVIARRLAAAAVSKGRALELELLDEVSARGHEERIERVLGHVVQNALDATPIEGRVSLCLRRVGSNAQVEVVDTGCGMTQEFMDQRLFKPFQTTKAAGMGIGAYESYQYLQELGGKINVESAPGQGTKVTILLPLFFAESGREAGLAEVR